jgi:uncharacterized protein DUF6883
MMLPRDTVIALEKLTRYLLIPQTRGDKSDYLARAGYSLDNDAVLLRDLRAQILPLEALPLENNEFGQFYEIAGTLRGPNEVELKVRTIWMREQLTGVTKFITLIPDTEGA